MGVLMSCSRFLRVVACLLLLTASGCDDEDKRILAVPSHVTQGLAGPCASFDHQTTVSAFVTVPRGGAAPQLQATSSTPKITVTQAPLSAGPAPGGNGHEYRFGFSCNERGVDGTITLSDPAGQYTEAKVKVQCLKTLRLLPIPAHRNFKVMHPGSREDIWIETDPSTQGVTVRALLDDGAGRFQITPSTKATDHRGRARPLSVSCMSPGDGRALFAVAEPGWQELRCPLQCRGEEVPGGDGEDGQ